MSWQSPILTVHVIARGTHVLVAGVPHAVTQTVFVWHRNITINDLAIPDTYCSRDSTGYSCPRGMSTPCCHTNCICVTQEHHNQWPGDPWYLLFTWQHRVLMSSWHEVHRSWPQSQSTRIQWIWWVRSVTHHCYCHVMCQMQTWLMSQTQAGLLAMELARWLAGFFACWFVG